MERLKNPEIDAIFIDKSSIINEQPSINMDEVERLPEKEIDDIFE